MIIININEEKNIKQKDILCNDNIRLNNQIALFSNNDFLQKKTSDPCIICFDIITDVVITQCRHIFCLTCANVMSDNLKKNFNFLSDTTF